MKMAMNQISKTFLSVPRKLISHQNYSVQIIVLVFVLGLLMLTWAKPTSNYKTKS